MNTTAPNFDAAPHRNCAGADLDTFFQGQGSMYLEAREICDGCPLLDSCFSYALCNDIAGFWGGTSEADRKKIRKLLGLKPITVGGDMALSGIFQGAGLACEGQARSISKQNTELWEACDQQEAFTARDLVLEEYAERRKRAIAHTQKNAYTTRSNMRLFTDDQVRRIRVSEDSTRVLADRYQVSSETIRNIRSRRRYADVLDLEAVA